MAFPPRLLNEGEELILDLRPHWWYMSGPGAGLLGSVLLGVVVIQYTDVRVLELAAAALIVFCIVWFLVRYSKWVTTNFVVTGDRVVFRQGVIAKQGVEIPLERINTVFFNQSIFERMLGAGDLGIESAGERGSETFSDVRRPSAVQNEIYRQMERNNDRMFGRVRQSNQPAPTEPAVDIPAQLERLDDLRRRGVLSEQEFAAKKAQLLERM